MDKQTLYRLEGVRQQRPYTQRGQFEARGGRINSGSTEINSGDIDINYQDGSQVRQDRTRYGGGLTVQTNSDPRLNAYSNLSRPSERAWAGITIELLKEPRSLLLIQLVKGPVSEDGKMVYDARFVKDSIGGVLN
ncbi:hypothetical protein ACVBEJ_07640 [Porticoccus sp. GXU_MW_L64]